MVSSFTPQNAKKMDVGYYGNSSIGNGKQAKVDRLKFAIVVLSTLLFMSGCVTLCFSVIALIRYELLGYAELFRSVLLAAIIPWIAATSGTLSVTMTPLFGCHGAVAQRRNLLVIYFLYLLAMLLVDLVMCIWVIVTADTIQKELDNSIRSGVLTYNRDPVIAAALDDLQRNLACCGSDYGIIDYGHWGPPPSCLHDNLFTPCIGKMKSLYMNYWLVGVGVFIGIGIILTLTMVLIILLLGALKSKWRPPRPRDPDRSRAEVGTAHAQSGIPPAAPPPPPLPPSHLKQTSGVIQIANGYTQSSVV